VWLPVVGYEGFYEVSNRGQVRSVYRRVRCDDNRERGVPAKVLTPAYIDGYAYVSLNATSIGKRKSEAVHRIVAPAFLGKRPSAKHQINHKNSIRSDNRAENLEWVTAEENSHHARDKGRLVHGEAHHFAVLSRENVEDIHRRTQAGERRQALADEYGVSYCTIDAILAGRVWKHLLPRDYERPKGTTAGEMNGSAKLTAEQVMDIRRLYASAGHSTYALGQQFNVSQGAISAIVRGKTWRHLPLSYSQAETREQTWRTHEV
jgi:hypothetical protein